MADDLRDSTENMEVLHDLQELRKIGKVGKGVTRIAGSVADIEGRLWLLDRFRIRGLIPELDEVGNATGRSSAHERAVLVGSHSDTVSDGGWLDGALGVIYGLHAAEYVNRLGLRAGADVVSFADEEGSYAPCIGSRYLLNDAYEAKEYGNTVGRVRESLSATCGVVDTLRRSGDELKGRYKFFLEAHIEQGPVLEASGDRIGIVTGIVGIRRCAIRIEGRADHAGTTPMSMRRDAGRAMIHLLAKLDRILEAGKAEHTVWNFGTLSFEPGAANVVPRLSSTILEFRDQSTVVLDELETSVRAEVEKFGKQESSVSITIEKTIDLKPVLMDRRVIQVIKDACEHLKVSYRMIQSGAGHDAMIAARHLPSGMMFVPSIGGRSHDPDEDTDPQDLLVGAIVFKEALKRLCEIAEEM